MGTGKIFRNKYVAGSLQVNNTITASSNISVTGSVSATKTITASSGLKVATETATTATTTIAPYGHTTINAGSTKAKSWTLGTPAAGYVKTISVKAAPTTATPRNVLAATAVAILTTGSTTANKIRLFKEGDSVVLVGASTVLWCKVAHSGLTLFSNSTSTT